MKKFGKLRISLLLALLVLLTLSLTAWAEGTDGRVTAAATENSIEFVSIDEVKYLDYRQPLPEQLADHNRCSRGRDGTDICRCCRNPRHPAGGVTSEEFASKKTARQK